MSNAKKCDRCGKFYDKYKGVRRIEGGFFYDSIALSGDKCAFIDLCETCMTDLINWLDGGNYETKV